MTLISPRLNYSLALVQEPFRESGSSDTDALIAQPMIEHIRLYFSHQDVRRRLQRSLKIWTAQEHPFGSSAQLKLAHRMKAELMSRNHFLGFHEFSVQTPNRSGVMMNMKSLWHRLPGFLRPNLPTRTVSGINVLAKVLGQRPCAILLGSHYDTKIIPDGAYYGANDSGSSSAALFEIIRYFHQSFSAQVTATSICDLIFVWFDGEESVLDDWNEGMRLYGFRDNTYGSRSLVADLERVGGSAGPLYQLPSSLDSHSYPIVGLILLDMIGSPQMKLTPDRNSDSKLRRWAWQSTRRLGLSHRLGTVAMRIEDDHLAFMNQQIPAVNLIDFYHTQHWHQSTDIEAHIDYSSIADAAAIATTLAIMMSFQHP